jgi:5'-AMP-activated protein kinase, catalytic alpha subunit
VKPENMLLDVHNRLKIVDFGLSNMYKAKEQLATACGSPCYASPEMIKGETYDPELTDVWSLGIVLFTMIMAKLPFEDDNTSVLYSKIKSGLYLIDRKVSPEYKDLLGKLINIKPDQRLTLKEIKKHPWFVNFAKINSFGINVGFDRIPIDEKIVHFMESLGYPASQTKRYLAYNVKNECTTAYYLFLKKQFRTGLSNAADICSDTFN